VDITGASVANCESILQLSTSSMVKQRTEREISEKYILLNTSAKHCNSERSRLRPACGTQTVQPQIPVEQLLTKTDLEQVRTQQRNLLHLHNFTQKLKPFIFYMAEVIKIG